MHQCQTMFLIDDPNFHSVCANLELSSLPVVDFGTVWIKGFDMLQISIHKRFQDYKIYGLFIQSTAVIHTYHFAINFLSNFLLLLYSMHIWSWCNETRRIHTYLSPRQLTFWKFWKKSKMDTKKVCTYSCAPNTSSNLNYITNWKIFRY